MFVGESQVMRELMAGINKIAEAPDTTVLIEGDRGTGKDVWAHILHTKTPRRQNRPFVRASCSCFTDEALQSELFGHEERPFAGATQIGYGAIDAAAGGTLLVEDVSDMALEVQAGVLHMLNTGSFRRLGGLLPVRHDVRLVASTSKDLSELRDAGVFQGALYQRLSTFHVRLPTLRERREDIVPLARYFVGVMARRLNRPALHLTVEAERTLSGYDFPGNVRQLKDRVESAALRARGEVVGLEELAAHDWPRENGRAPFFCASLDAKGQTPSLRTVKARYMAAVLNLTKGNRTRAARLLGVSLPTLRKTSTKDD